MFDLSSRWLRPSRQTTRSKSQRARGASSPRRRLIGEQLESREMMAANLTSALALTGYGFITTGDIAHDAAGATYIAGSLASPSSGLNAGPVDFDPLNSYADNRDIVTAPGTGTAGFVARYDASGAFAWVTFSGVGNSELNVQRLAIGASGAVYAAGSYYGAPELGGQTLAEGGDYGYGDRFVARLDPGSGAAVWLKAIDVAFVERFTHGLAIDEARDRVYLAGDHNLSNPGQKNAIVIALDQSDPNNVTVDWTASIVSSVSSSALDVAVDASGSVYVGGAFQGSADFDPGSKTASQSSGSGGRFETPTAGYLWKLSSAGNLAWARVIPGGRDAVAVVSSVEIDAAQNAVISGYFQGTIDFDPGKPKLNRTSNGRDVFVASFNSAGSLVYATSMSAAGDQLASDMVLGADGTIYISGVLSGNAGGFVVSLDTNRQFASQIVISGTVYFTPRLSLQPGTGALHVVGSFAGDLDVDGDGDTDLSGGTAESDFDFFWSTYAL